MPVKAQIFERGTENRDYRNAGGGDADMRSPVIDEGMNGNGGL